MRKKARGEKTLKYTASFAFTYRYYYFYFIQRVRAICDAAKRIYA